MNYTTVIGVDEYHLEQLRMTWPTWVANKPHLLDHPLVVFYDRIQVTEKQVWRVVGNHPNVKLVGWPHREVTLYPEGSGKWRNPQRYRMLAGFVYVAAEFVTTPYWLKIDTDVVASRGGEISWIENDWFIDDPAIVSHAWSFTKPPDQMLVLDDWYDSLPCVPACPRLDLRPEPNASRLSHARIISFVGFFQTEFTQICAALAERSCGFGKLPVPSQDGYMWFLSARLGKRCRRVNMKTCGWEHWNTKPNVRRAAERALNAG